MTASPQIDVRDLKSVRRAAGTDQRVMLGDDYVAPTATTERAVLTARRRRRGVIKLIRSPLAGRIITFNLVSLIVLVAGVMFFSPSRDNLAYQRANALVTEAELAAKIFAAQAGTAAQPLGPSDAGSIVATLSHLGFRGGAHLAVYDPAGVLLAELQAPDGLRDLGGLSFSEGGTFISDMLARIGLGISRLTGRNSAEVAANYDAKTMVPLAITAGTRVDDSTDAEGRLVFTIVSPIQSATTPLGAVVITSAAGELDRLVLSEREQLLTMFVVGALVSVAFSLLLASTIANPLSDLADAAELGRDRNARKMSPGRVRIPDLTARPDEIGRLSGALRGMVAALYERIEANEQFAADVAHEIKNPLASLRSAVGTMRMAKREDQRERLLEVIEHDVRRLDRLVSDISNASRLDSELVKEEEQSFDLLKMLGNINDYLGKQASEKGIEYIADIPGGPIIVQGLEGRLAQVFVNLITNAISFCEDGDAIRVWARKRENRVLVVVEDTGPGIPEQALTKIFKRFYSERPAGQFGNNSGLGLAISKQIIEAHGGVIWAENIRPTDADPASDPLGARFVVGLPV